MDKADRKRFIDPYRIATGKGFRLARHDPGDTRGLGSEEKGRAAEMLARGVEWLAEEQEKLYAQDRWGVLLVFQAMDAAGKDSTIKHVMSGVTRRACR
jgi:polyphosphate kinase 2 (PPK2 family)